MKKKIAVIGAGISGLTCAWYLKKYGKENVDVTIYEASKSPGGCIHTTTKEGFLFEQGPHSWRCQNSLSPIDSLIEDVGLSHEVIEASLDSKIRYLYLDKKLQKLPTGIFSLLRSPFRNMMLKAFWSDIRARKNDLEDESIHSFISRRLGTDVAEVFFDPLASGIYAGDISKLSILSTFPMLKAYENTHGSLIRGAFSNKNEKVKNSIRTLKKGMQSLTDKLACYLQGEIQLSSGIEKVEFSESKIFLHLNGEIRDWVDHIFFAIPANKLAELLKLQSENIANNLQQIPSAPIAVVNIGYKKNILLNKGFGYLIPSKEKEEILGVIWDSCTFPQQSLFHEETRLSVMIGGAHCKNFPIDDKQAIAVALAGVNSHLNIDLKPDAISVKIIQNAIPQYNVGHNAILKAIEIEAKELSSKMTIIGNSFYGVSLNDSVACAEKMANQFCRLI